MQEVRYVRARPPSNLLPSRTPPTFSSLLLLLFLPTLSFLRPLGPLVRRRSYAPFAVHEGVSRPTNSAHSAASTNQQPPCTRPPSTVGQGFAEGGDTIIPCPPPAREWNRSVDGQRGAVSLGAGRKDDRRLCRAYDRYVSYIRTIVPRATSSPL